MLFLFDFCVKIFYVNVEILSSPLTAHCSFIIPHMQYFFSKDAMRCHDKVTALHLLTHRLYFAEKLLSFFRSPLIFRSCWTRFCISLEPFLFFSADRSWNLRLSESRDMLAWTLPSVSKLNNVKQVQDDHQICSVVFCYIEEQKRHIFERWAVSSEFLD